jgi:hypothetical protein
MGPSDFHLTGYRKKHVASNKFAAGPNVKQAVISCLQTFELNINGDYVEVEVYHRVSCVHWDQRKVFIISVCLLLYLHIQLELNFL